MSGMTGDVAVFISAEGAARYATELTDKMPRIKVKLIKRLEYRGCTVGWGIVVKIGSHTCNLSNAFKDLCDA